MGNQKSYSTDFKLNCVKRYLEGKESSLGISKDVGINNSTLCQWVNNYESLGLDGITNGKKIFYTEKLKELAVEDYLAGNGSLKTICKKHGIRSDALLRNWIFKYNEHKKETSSFTGGIPIMLKKRKITTQERIEIVKDCMKHELNYQQTAMKYNISYQQVYCWIKKYKSLGVNGLLDKRGIKKTWTELTEVELLRAENKILREENRRNQRELLYLKKLEEIERKGC